LEATENVAEFDFTPTTFDIILVIQEGIQGLTVSCIYKTTRFDASTIEQLLDDFERLLARLIAQPEQSLSTLGRVMEPG
jgi:hypothetical protein